MTNAYRTGILAVVLGAAVVFTELPPAWTLAGGIAALAIGATALVLALRHPPAA
ncbi:MAG: hypothetical protein QJR09_05190 [Micrococcus sp.]|nr:hypothetical protein [Micrococcus sp.]